MGRREHAGGVPESESSFGEIHPLVGFDYDAIDGPPAEDTRSVAEFAEALGEILRWLNPKPQWEDGRCKPRAVYMRVMALSFMLQPESIGVESQKELAKRLGVSRSWLNHVVQDFVTRYGFTAQHLKLANPPKPSAKRRRRAAQGTSQGTPWG